MEEQKQRGVLLVNLGSPDSPSVPDVRRYLRQFLMDGRVIDMAYVPRFLLVNCCILPFRPKQSAEAYHKIWWKEGSPLVVTSEKVSKQLQGRVPFPVELAMRYQNPSIAAGLQKLRSRGVNEVLLIPLFPHYAMSSYETAVEEVKQLLPASGISKLSVVRPYYDEPAYIAALTSSAAPYLNQGYDHLLFSFHGIPERHLRKSDPTGQHCLSNVDCCKSDSPALPTCYRAQCFRTMEAFVKKAGIKNYSIAFQSRLGRDPWLKPYTDFEIVRLAQEGVKKLLVICPAFVSDCLETIEEIGLRAKETFIEAGGKDLVLIPCMNEHPLWITALEGMIRKAFGTGIPGAPALSQHELEPSPGVGHQTRLG